MTAKARQYRLKDIKKLFALSGNQCAEPTCRRKMISDDGNNVLGEIAHICAASLEGPRYDSTMTDDERRSFENLILLCADHHTEIDNPETINNYSARLLLEWKENHLLNLNGYSVKFNEKLIDRASKGLDKFVANIQGDNNQVIQGGITTTKIKRQIIQGKGSTYNENN